MKTLLFAFAISALFTGCAKYGFEPETDSVPDSEYNGPVTQEEKALETQEQETLNVEN